MGGEGPLPVAAGEVDDILPVVPEIRKIELVGDRIAGGVGHGVGLRVEVQAEFRRQGRVSLPRHTVRRRFALGGQDIVDRPVGVRAHGQVVDALIDDEGLCVVRIVGFKPLLADGHGHRLAPAGFQKGRFLKAHQLHRCLFDTVPPVVVSIGLLGVYLDNLLAGHVAGVGHGHRDGIGAVLPLGAEPAVRKPRVRQAVSKGELNRGGVVVAAGVPLAEHPVLIAGLIVAVADVDALLIGHVLVLVVVGGGYAERAVARLNFRRVGIGVVVRVQGRGRGGGMVGDGIRQLAGGVDLAGKRLGHGVQAALSHIADPEAGLDFGVILQPAQLRHIARVDQHDNLVERGVVLEHLQHARLVVGQGEKGAAALVGGQVQVVLLAAGPGEDEDRRVAVVREGGPDRVGILSGGTLVHPVDALGVIKGVPGHPLAHVLPVVFLIEAPERIVDGIPRRLESLAQGGHVRRTDLAGAGAAVEHIHRGFGEQAQSLVRAQRKAAVLIFQEDHSLRLNLLAYPCRLAAQLLQGIGAFKVLGIPLLPALNVHNHGHGLVQRGGDDGREAHGRVVQDQQQRKDERYHRAPD